MGTSFCLNRQAYVKLIIFSSWQWKKNSTNWFCHSLEANQSPAVDVPVFILRTDGQPLLDGVEEAQDHWKRNLVGLLADFSLERGKGGCLTAFVLDGFLQRRPEIFDRPKGSDARGVPWERSWPVVAGSPGCCLPCGRWPDTFAPNPICP